MAFSKVGTERSSLTVYSLNFCLIAVYVPPVSLFTIFHGLFDCMLYDWYQENTDIWVVTQLTEAHPRSASEV